MRACFCMTAGIYDLRREEIDTVMVVALLVAEINSSLFNNIKRKGDF